MNAGAKCLAPLIHGEGCECGATLSSWREKPVLFKPAPSPVFTNDVTKPTLMPAATGATAFSGAVTSGYYAPSFETRPRSVTMSYLPTPSQITVGHSMQIMSFGGSNLVAADFVYSDQELERQKQHAELQLKLMQMQREHELTRAYVYNKLIRGNYA